DGPARGRHRALGACRNPRCTAVHRTGESARHARYAPYNGGMKTSHNYSVEVSVDSAFNDEQSQPERQQFVYSYTIRLRNAGPIGAKLLTLHSIITDGNGKVEEVSSDDVFGQQPHIEPGAAFEYSSGAVLETDAGIM